MYEKQTWVDGDVLSASKLNHIEDGVEESNLPEITTKNYGGYLGVIADEDNTTDVIVVPQQTVTVSDSSVQVQSDFPDPLPISCSATITINGVDYEADYNDGSGDGAYIYSPTVDSPPYYEFNQDSEPSRSSSQGWWFDPGDGSGGFVSGTYTVKVTLHTLGAKWGIIHGNNGGEVA